MRKREKEIERGREGGRDGERERGRETETEGERQRQRERERITKCAFEITMIYSKNTQPLSSGQKESYF